MTAHRLSPHSRAGAAAVGLAAVIAGTGLTGMLVAADAIGHVAWLLAYSAAAAAAALTAATVLRPIRKPDIVRLALGLIMAALLAAAVPPLNLNRVGFLLFIPFIIAGSSAGLAALIPAGDGSKLEAMWVSAELIALVGLLVLLAALGLFADSVAAYLWPLPFAGIVVAALRFPSQSKHGRPSCDPRPAAGKEAVL